jgi:hypothetical protein
MNSKEAKGASNINLLGVKVLGLAVNSVEGAPPKLKP